MKAELIINRPQFDTAMLRPGVAIKYNFGCGIDNKVIYGLIIDAKPLELTVLICDTTNECEKVRPIGINEVTTGTIELEIVR